MLDRLWQDLRYSVRSLAAKPGLAFAALLTLALGIGANTAIFTVLDAAVLRPPPYADADRLVSVFNSYPGMLERASIAIPDYLDRRDQAPALADLALYTDITLNLADTGGPERIVALKSTPSLFGTLGVAPALGRAYAEAEAQPGNDRYVVLSDAAWHRYLAGAPDAVGRSLRLNGEAYTVLGVMPPGFYFPTREVALWVPFAFTDKDRSDASRGHEYSSAVGRLAEGATIAQLDQQFDAIVARNIERISSGATARSAQYADFLRQSRFSGRARPLQDDWLGDSGQTLWLLQGATLLVLAIACANLANLSLARALARRRELTVRRALGATRGRVLRHLLGEGFVLAAGGAALGVGLAWASTQALADALGLDPANGHFAIALAPGSIGFACALALATGLIFGSAPMLAPWLDRPQEALREAARGGGEGPVARRVRAGLVVVQTALATVLLVSAGLLIQSFARLTDVRPGFTTEGLTTAVISLPQSRYPKPEQQTEFFDRALAAARAVPGVEAAALAYGLPFANQDGSSSYEIEGVAHPGAPSPHGYIRMVDEDYFKVAGIPVLRGRAFRADDVAGAPAVGLIDELLAQKYFAGQDPIGRRMTFDDPADPKAKFWTIVGVVGTVNPGNLATRVTKETYYLPFRQEPTQMAALVLKSALPADVLGRSLREAVAKVDPEQPLYDLKPYRERIRLSLSGHRAPMQLLVAFALVALVLAAVGIYGVLSFLVSTRTGELGVRMALGARARDVLVMVLRQGALLGGAGLLLGFAGALVATRWLEHQLFEVGPVDPASYVGVGLVLGTVALLACWFPARRAAGTDPIQALRHE